MIQTYCITSCGHDLRLIHWRMRVTYFLSRSHGIKHRWQWYVIYYGEHIFNV